MENRQYNNHSHNNYHNNNNNHNNNHGNNGNRRRNYNNHNSYSNNANKQEGPKREAILDLNKYKDQQVRVDFVGGRQVQGTLKGFDQLMNLVLENVTETIRDQDDESVLTSETRHLGFVVVRGPALLTLSPVDGTQVIENPFAQQEPVV